MLGIGHLSVYRLVLKYGERNKRIKPSMARKKAFWADVNSLDRIEALNNIDFENRNAVTESNDTADTEELPRSLKAVFQIRQHNEVDLIPQAHLLCIQKMNLPASNQGWER